MSKRRPSTRAQSIFLRAFRENPDGPAPQNWPAPGVLRRWLADPKFRAALAQIRDALRLRADIHIATAAATAAQSIQSTLRAAQSGLAASAASELPADAQTAPDLSRQLKPLTDLLRLAHARHRFDPDARAAHTAAVAPPPTPPADPLPHTDPQQQRSGYEAILLDPYRLKSMISLLIMRGHTEHEPFLAAFPKELAEAQASAARRAPNPT
jgi:hypothetical protein